MRVSWLPLVALVLTLVRPAHADPKSVRLEVLSFNVWGIPYITPDREERIAEISRRVAELAPDLVAFQEVWLREDAAKIGSLLERAGLTHQRYSYEEASGLWIGSRFPIERVDFHAFELGTKPAVPWHLDYFAKKGVAIVRVTTPLGPVDLANMHLQASYAIGDYGYVQFGQALQAAERLSAPATSSEPVPPLIAVGDLNSEPSSIAFRTLTTRAGLEPAADSFGVDAILARPGSTLTLASKGVRAVMRGPVALPSGKRLELSDHPALLASYELKRCQGCTGARRGWRDVARDALVFLRGKHHTAERLMWLDRLLSLTLLAAAAAIVWRVRRSALVPRFVRIEDRKHKVQESIASQPMGFTTPSPTDGRRETHRFDGLAALAWRAAAYSGAFLLLGTAAWLGYLGWSFDPYQVQVIASQCARLEASPDATP
jgi:endonuclease/exonuclease/phosphatase family metal-dependent hydrolase